MIKTLRSNSPARRASAHGNAVMRMAGLCLVGAAMVPLAGCSTLSTAGPLSKTITREAASEAPPFLLVPMSRLVLAELGGIVPEDFTPLATQQPAPDSVVRVGDMISVTLWEYGSGLLGPVPGSGLASPELVGAQSATVPNQTVDQTGTIMVPFAGEIRAAGQTTRQIQKAIIAALRGNANQTQVLVQIVQTNENAVTVTGDVNKPGRFPLATSGTRLLDAISTAGGGSGKARDMLVQLGRGGVVRSVRLAAVQSDPAQNIYLNAGDVITLDHEPQNVVVLGATNKNSVVPFGRTQLSLAEALGHSGGLDDRLANPYGVYVLRYEDSAVAPKLQTGPVPDYLVTGKTFPVVYQFNLKNADGLLLAQSFNMRDRDMVYVSDSPSVQIGKLTGIFNSIGAIFKNNNFNAFRNNEF